MLSYQVSWALSGTKESGSPVREGVIGNGRFALVRLLAGDSEPAEALLEPVHAGAGGMINRE